MKKLLAVFCLLAVQILCLSCSDLQEKPEREYFGEIYGKVTDSSSGSPISNASVILSPGGATRWTNSEGYYEFKDLDPELQYNLSVQHTDYKTDKRTVSIRVGEPLEMNFSLLANAAVP
jgi:hypothetical protein